MTMDDWRYFRGPGEYVPLADITDAELLHSWSMPTVLIVRDALLHEAIRRGLELPPARPAYIGSSKNLGERPIETPHWARKLQRR